MERIYNLVPEIAPDIGCNNVKYLVLYKSFSVTLVAQRQCVHNSLRTPNRLQWRHNGCDSVSNHQPHDCLLSRLFRRRSKNSSKLRVTGLCVVSSPVTGEFPTQMASKAENVSIWWHHHDDHNQTEHNNTVLRCHGLHFTHVGNCCLLKNKTTYAISA